MLIQLFPVDIEQKDVRIQFSEEFGLLWNPCMATLCSRLVRPNHPDYMI
jgi:hypothetical protein